MALIVCCPECARKIEQRYIVQQESGTEPGQCQFCFVEKRLARYEITPQKTRYNHRRGGGERNRSGARG